MAKLLSSNFATASSGVGRTFGLPWRNAEENPLMRIFFVENRGFLRRRMRRRLVGKLKQTETRCLGLFLNLISVYSRCGRKNVAFVLCERDRTPAHLAPPRVGRFLKASRSHLPPRDCVIESTHDRRFFGAVYRQSGAGETTSRVCFK